MLLYSDMGMQEEQARQLSTPDLAGSELGRLATVALGGEPGHCGHRAAEVGGTALKTSVLQGTANWTFEVSSSWGLGVRT